MTSVAKDMMSTVKLNDGVMMPLFGLGVYNLRSGEGGLAEVTILHALKNGYRLIDTAEFYGNETDVGCAVKRSGLKREDVFVVSKIWDASGRKHCLSIFHKALKEMDLGYIDLYLIHSPNGSRICETFKVMLELKQQGLIRSCGVSNFGVHHLEEMKAAGLPAPSVNQIELHPWQQKSDIVAYCQKNNITVMGYSPLAKGQRFGEPILAELGKRYGKSPAQIMIRWSVQKGYITIPKTANLTRIIENGQVFDWLMSDEDMNRLGDLLPKSCCWDPTTIPWNG